MPPWEHPFLYLLFAAGGLGLTIAISALSYSLLEKPFLRLKKKFTFVASRPE
jgi:peptidoglycan/LPS O-acetylase OafA/YrhL